MGAAAGSGDMRSSMTMSAVAVPMRVLTVTALTFQLSVIVTDSFVGFDLLLGECSSLLGIVASEVSHLFGVSSDVFAPGTAAEMPSCMFEIRPDCIALRLVPVPQLFLGASG
ncbi:MAG: hypothetical protein EA424_04260 [Planctomycetaceae bacterium]|nr:MAG: hypothetical protein EA424_04260 [Planctomycetaceae bacterium]